MCGFRVDGKPNLSYGLFRRELFTRNFKLRGSDMGQAHSRKFPATHPTCPLCLLRITMHTNKMLSTPSVQNPGRCIWHCIIPSDQPCWLPWMSKSSSFLQWPGFCNNYNLNRYICNIARHGLEIVHVLQDRLASSIGCSFNYVTASQASSTSNVCSAAHTTLDSFPMVVLMVVSSHNCKVDCTLLHWPHS